MSHTNQSVNACVGYANDYVKHYEHGTHNQPMTTYAGNGKSR